MTEKPTLKNRLCLLCGGPVPEGDGVIHSELGALSHRGVCDRSVMGYYRDYSASRRGRLRRPAEVRRLLRRQLEMKEAGADSGKPGQFAFHFMPNGGVDFVGTVVGLTRDTVRLEVLDAVMATGCGMWCPTGETKAIPRRECRFFTDKITCLTAALLINRGKYATAQKDSL